MSQSSRNRRKVESQSVNVPMIESLEGRALLSAISLSRGGTLFVEGTRRADDVIIHRNPANRGEIEVSTMGRPRNSPAAFDGSWW